MAEAAVSLVIDRLADLLIEHTTDKIVFLKHVRVEVDRLQTLLIHMKCFLKSADEKQEDDPRIRNWVSQMRVAAYDAEDVIETFIVKIGSLKKKGLLQRLVHFPQRLVCLYRMQKRIESIKGRICDIDKSCETFGIRNLGESRSNRGEELLKLRETSPFTEDKDLVGLEEKTDSLVAQLLVGDKRRRITSIVGMPGVGKTTLARKVYKHAGVTSQFHCRAWVYISQKCNLREVLSEIIKQVEIPTSDLIGMLERLQKPDLERMLRQKLEDKRYLIVLDDIWEEEVWDCLTGAFPDVGNGSRILFTSRHENVAKSADVPSVPYKMKTLDKNDSWRLFLRKALGDVNESCGSALGSIGRKIVDRCGGLPLAITVIGCLLRGKSSESEWQRVLDTISTHWSSGRKGVSAILELSYNDLPSDLKPCFLYFALLPEYSEIPTRKLFHLWLAEGLIQQKGAENVEDIAANQLDLLIGRNLVQVVKVKADGSAKGCQVHDLLRDLAITKAREEIMLEIHKVGESKQSTKCRHLALYFSSESHICDIPSTPYLRSVLFFSLNQVELNINLDFSAFNLLRVLDMENSGSTCLTEGIGALSLLRYLGLRNTRMAKLPMSIGCLRNLQTLDIFTRKSSIKVPNVLWKLENLKNLYICGIQHSGPLKFENLRDLQTLSNIDAHDLMRNNLMKLTGLRKLGVEASAGSDIGELCSNIAKLSNLRKLCLIIGGKHPTLIGLSKLSRLTKLKILRPLEVLPGPHHFPPHLSHLSLVNTMMQEDPMPILENLEHLAVLKLKIAYSGLVLKASENGFLQLKVLELRQLYHLSFLDIGEGAMPDLRCLRIIDCYHLNIPSRRLKTMTSIQKLEITGCEMVGRWYRSHSRMARAVSI